MQPDLPPDGPRSWQRLAVALVAGTVSSIGMWSVVLVLPVVGADFGVGFIGKAKAKIDEHDVAAEADEVEMQPGQHAGEAATLRPGEKAGAEPEAAESGPGRPVGRQPEVGLLAGAAHALEGRR